jgi:uncharacterized lipoprotein NlpE involved in copper resistance
MRRGLLIALALIGLASLVGCQSTSQWIRQNDNLAHAAYDSRPMQDVIQWTDAHDVHALADTQFAKDWNTKVDYDCAEGYYQLHEWLNSEGRTDCP